MQSVLARAYREKKACNSLSTLCTQHASYSEAGYSMQYSGKFWAECLLKQGRTQHKEGCKQQPLLGSKSGTGVK